MMVQMMTIITTINYIDNNKRNGDNYRKSFHNVTSGMYEFLMETCDAFWLVEDDFRGERSAAQIPPSLQFP